MESVASVELDLDRKRKWQFDANAIVALHEALGDDAFEQIAELKPPEDENAKPKVGKLYKVFRALLWAGLATDSEEDEKPLTLKQAGSLCSPSKFWEIVSQFMPAYNGSMAGESPNGAAKSE